MRNCFLKLFSTAVLVSVAVSCYDDAALWDAVKTNSNKIEALERQVNQINQEITDIKIMIAALKEKDSVVDVYQIPDNTGYIILFSSGKKISITNGKDGVAGKDGADGQTPLISVSLGEDGYWYWTINGVWLLDSSGNKIKAEGKDAITPEFKIEDGYWFISYDKGSKWEMLGKATGKDGDTLFKSVTEDSDNLYITMANGDVFTFPKRKDFRIIINNTDPIKCIAGQEIEIPYSLENVGRDLEFTTLCEGAWTARIVKKDDVSGRVIITVPKPYSDGKVVLLACSEGVSSMKVIAFEEGFFSVVDDITSILVDDEGGSYSVTFSTNLELSFKIWDDCKSWVKEIRTRSESVTAVISVAPNETSEERIGHFSVYYGEVRLTDITLVQGNAPDFVDLGLSVKWRKYNVGASKSYDYGNYFAWGEVIQKESYYYYWSNYKYCNGSGTLLTKYVTDSNKGTIDDKVVLEPDDDAAVINLGNGWRMPTFEEFKELRDNCSWEIVTDYNGTGINGFVFKSNIPGYTDRFIFFPAGGCCSRDYSGVSSQNKWGHYWSSSLMAGNNESANGYVMYCTSNHIENYDCSRWLGKTIRPVKDFDVTEKTVFKLYESSVNFDFKAQKYAVSLLSNVGAQCDLSRVSDWVTIISQQGKTFLFEITKNRTGAVRTGNIIFRSDDGSKTCYLSISQEASTEVDATALNITFSNTSGTIGGSLYIGKSYTFNVTATPSNATTNYEWTVKNTSIATISGNGNTASLNTKDFGRTEVVVTEKNTGISASYEFSTAVTDFQFTENTGETSHGYPKITMVVGEEHQLQYTCAPSYATNVFSDLRAFKFKEVKDGVYLIVSESSFVDIDANGLMTAKAVGNTIIESFNSYGVYKASGGVDGIFVQILSEYSESEPNNDFPYANQLKMGGPTSFYISTTTDVDTFKYSANKSSISFDLTYTGDGSSEIKHLRWELYDSSCNLRGSGTFSLGASGDVISMSDKYVGTSGGYLKFYFPTNWYSYPETRPSGKLSVKVY